MSKFLHHSRYQFMYKIIGDFSSIIQTAAQESIRGRIGRRRSAFSSQRNFRFYIAAPSAVQLRQTRYTSIVAFTFEAQLPPWMTFISGDVPVVFVAPHGGRRPPEAPILDSIKVNDLYTAELTTELAKITGGYA